jgi:hypothetical protein
LSENGFKVELARRTITAVLMELAAVMAAILLGEHPCHF